jgi:lysyl-tRNA synthetase class 2
MLQDWRPGTDVAMLRRRAQLLQQTRQFFAQREVLEVETPCLLRSSATDVHLSSFGLADGAHFLQTSPEFAMKRLLAAGSGAIYQLCKCFRSGESSRRHNPEFTMLEWYRPGFSLEALMQEVAELVGALLPVSRFNYQSYGEVFEEYVGLNPHRASTPELEQYARRELDLQAMAMSRGDWLDLLMSHRVEPNLPGAVFVQDFPWQQASLSRVQIDKQGQRVARRFELFVDGLELANGYDELCDADELEQRAQQDNSDREQRGLPAMPLDCKLLAAHQYGLPACAGVAVGFDRVLMLATGSESIDRVLAFSEHRL